MDCDCFDKDRKYQNYDLLHQHWLGHLRATVFKYEIRNEYLKKNEIKTNLTHNVFHPLIDFSIGNAGFSTTSELSQITSRHVKVSTCKITFEVVSDFPAVNITECASITSS